MKVALRVEVESDDGQLVTLVQGRVGVLLAGEQEQAYLLAVGGKYVRVTLTRLTEGAPQPILKT